MTTINIRFALKDGAPAGQVEYGSYDPSTGFAEAWGVAEVAAGKGGTEITVNITRYKQAGRLIYVKPSKSGMLYWLSGAGSDSNFYVSDGVQHKTSNSAPYSVKYTSESEPINVDLQAPATAAWLVINAIKEYSTGTTVLIKSETENRARSSSSEAQTYAFGSGSISIYDERGNPAKCHGAIYSRPYNCADWCCIRMEQASERDHQGACCTIDYKEGRCTDGSRRL